MSKGEYEKTLKESGYKNVSLIYTDKRTSNRNKTTPATSSDLIHLLTKMFPPTYVAKRFLNLLDAHYPRSKKLHAIFNGNTVKVSYSCTQNMSNMIKSHKKNVINKLVKESKSCNCRVKPEYPLNGQCQVTDIIYKCTVLSQDKPNGDFKK